MSAPTVCSGCPFNGVCHEPRQYTMAKELEPGQHRRCEFFQDIRSKGSRLGEETVAVASPRVRKWPRIRLRVEGLGGLLRRLIQGGNHGW